MFPLILQTVVPAQRGRGVGEGSEKRRVETWESWTCQRAENELAAPSLDGLAIRLIQQGQNWADEN